MDDKEDINYKTLRKIQQAERTSPQITKINNEFFKDVQKFLHELEQRLEKEKKAQKKMLLAEECQNIEKIVRNIYEQREKKIMLAAISKARGGNPSIKSLLPEEKLFFDDLYQNIVSYRKKILESNEKTEELKKESEKSDTSKDNNESTEKHIEKETKQVSNNKENHHPIIRIIKDIPAFVGTDNKTYTLHQKDIVTLPEATANMLIKRKVAIPIKDKEA